MNTYLQRLKNAIELAVQGMSESDLTRRPSEGKWSPAEILEHLCLTYKVTTKNLERSLTAGRPLGGPRTLKQRLVNVLVLDLAYFPAGRDSPQGAKPKGLLVSGEVYRKLADMNDVIQDCEIKFGKPAFVADHPILGPLTTHQWRKFHWVHGRHHVKQILRIRKIG
ncbi:MAG: DUF1569 domain-containing protein [Terriglobales bacterium]